MVLAPLEDKTSLSLAHWIAQCGAQACPCVTVLNSYTRTGSASFGLHIIFWYFPSSGWTCRYIFSISAVIPYLNRLKLISVRNKSGWSFSSTSCVSFSEISVVVFTEAFRWFFNHAKFVWRENAMMGCIVFPFFDVLNLPHETESFILGHENPILL